MTDVALTTQIDSLADLPDTLEAGEEGRYDRWLSESGGQITDHDGGVVYRWQEAEKA